MLSQSKRTVPLFKVFMAPEDVLMPKLRDVLYSGQVTEGPRVKEFEQRFGELVGQPRILSFYSGTAALHTALMLAGVSQGDSVISTAMTAEPTNMAIRHAGGNVVWADVDPKSGNISPASIRERITQRTRAIMVVHYGGIPASIKEIRQIAEENGLPVIEDAAHALGARYGGRPLGSHSEYVMFSLQAIKHVTTIDGGMLACGRPEDVQRGRILRWFGIDRNEDRTKVDVDTVGFKYHMNDVTAALGLIQMDYAKWIIDRHVENGRYFDRALQGIPGLGLCSWDIEAEPSYWFYTLLAERRDDLARRLNESGISCSTVHRRNDLHSVFASSRTDLPGLDRFCSRVLHIPCGWWLAREDLEHIADVIRRGW